MPRQFRIQDCRSFAGFLALTLVTPALMAVDGDPASWQNLQRLVPGQTIEVMKTGGERFRGTFLAVADQSISLRSKHRDLAISRADTSRVRVRSSTGRKYTWIGAAIGAGAGAGIGAGIGEGVANESGGDFRNLKPAIIGASAVLCALAGALIGSSIGHRYTTIYSAR